MIGPRFLADLASRGQYHFTTSQALKAMGRGGIATRAVLRRLKAKGDLASPVRGFHVIVPPEYRPLGCLPPEQFVPQLMETRGTPYYAGLLSAAQFHGAAHHRPQVFQVVVPKNLPEIRCGKVRVEFVARRNASKVPVEVRNTPRGTIRISTPEATAVDLVIYLRRAGGLNNVATVLKELSEEIDVRKLAATAEGMAEAPAIQRLGHLLSRLGQAKKARALLRIRGVGTARPVPLVASGVTGSWKFDKRWRVFVNAEIEPDV